MRFIIGLKCKYSEVNYRIADVRFKAPPFALLTPICRFPLLICAPIFYRMKKFWLPTLLLVLVLITSCRISQNGKRSSGSLDVKHSEHLTSSVLWYQLSGEMRALYFQGYNVARYSLDNLLKESKSDKKKAVVVDIDETLLNNSPYEAKIILNNQSFEPQSWHEWVLLAKADTLPGALGFLKYAASKGVETFYISNRMENEVEATMKNLAAFGFPYVDEAHMIFKTITSSKEERRNKVLENYEILLLCGDNLGDFAAAFEGRTFATNMDSVNKYAHEFGKRFIILPNPMYGDWEKPIYSMKNMTEAQRDSARKALLHAY
jgi:5'-nucleotidase (lipoprotein e(P4) family)